MDRPFDRILSTVEHRFEDDATGHDIHHLKRVFRLGMQLAGEEGGDEEVVGAACLVHDLHRVMDGEEDGRFVPPAESLDEVRAVLEEAEFPDKKIDDVLHCVAVHEQYEFGGGATDDISHEAAIVQDADNLDAMGAIGIGRAFRFSGSHGNPMWRPDRAFDGEPYQKARLTDSTIYHFHEKLLRLKDTMNTETARELAEDRHAFMEQFLERFKAEWDGER